METKNYSFQATIELIGINPYVEIPDAILHEIFSQAGKNKGFIPVCGSINGLYYQQTLLKYKGLWRLYINTIMLKDSPKHVGKTIQVNVAVDTSDRTIKPHPKFTAALKKNNEAKVVFDGLSPSKQKEIVRYISSLKTEQSRDRIIEKAIHFLLGKGPFIGKNTL